MAKDSVYSLLQKPVTEHGRNIFPLDNRQIYSMKAGQITPVKALHFKPGDYFDIQAHDFSITFPMNTAAFLRGRKETAFYSVYYNAVWSLFNQYQASRSDPKTSAFDANSKLVEPRIPLYELVASCWSQWIKYMYYKYYLTYSADIDGVDLDLYQLAWLNSNVNSSSNEFTALSLSADVTDDNNYIQSVMGTDYLNLLYISNPYFTGQPSFRQWTCDVVGHFRAYSWLRKLDMLGYGNYYPLFSAAEAKIVDLGVPTDSASLGTF